MNLPTSVVITGCDSLPVLEQALHAARTFRPLSEGAVAALLKRTAHAGRDGKYELYKTTHHFDGTYQNPQWRSEEHTSELQSRLHLVWRLLLEKKKGQLYTKSLAQAATLVFST